MLTSIKKLFGLTTKPKIKTRCPDCNNGDIAVGEGIKVHVLDGGDAYRMCMESFLTNEEVKAQARAAQELYKRDI